MIPASFVVKIVGGPSREELFDALRLFNEQRRVEFEFLVREERGPMNSINHGRLKLPALVHGINRQFKWGLWLVTIEVLELYSPFVDEGELVSRTSGLIDVTYDHVHREGTVHRKYYPKLGLRVTDKLIYFGDLQA